MVPDVRIAGVATRRTASARSGQPSRTILDRSMSACVAIAPSVSDPLSTLISFSAGTRCRETRRSGFTSPSRIIATSAVPPATSRASPSSRPSVSIASGSDSGSTRRNGGRRTLSRARGREHRLDDLRVAGAATEIARERLADLVLARRRIVEQERLRRQHDAGRAVAALRGATLGERGLERIEPAVHLETLDRYQRAPAHVGGQDEAGANGAAVGEHRAGAA